MDFDFSEILAGAGAIGATVLAAYQNWDDQPGYMKFALIAGPVLMLGIFMATVG